MSVPIRQVEPGVTGKMLTRFGLAKANAIAREIANPRRTVEVVAGQRWRRRLGLGKVGIAFDLKILRVVKTNMEGTPVVRVLCDNRHGRKIWVALEVVVQCYRLIG